MFVGKRDTYANHRPDLFTFPPCQDRWRFSVTELLYDTVQFISTKWVASVHSVRHVGLGMRLPIHLVSDGLVRLTAYTYLIIDI